MAMTDEQMEAEFNECVSYLLSGDADAEAFDQETSERFGKLITQVTTYRSRLAFWIATATERAATITALQKVIDNS